MLYNFDGREPQIGSDTYISETALVIGDIKIGNNCYIGHGAILRGDYGTIEIGNGSAIEEGVVIHSAPNKTCFIGDNVTIGHGAIIHSKFIGNFSTIGMGAIVSLGAEVGGNSIIAEGSVVKTDQKIPEDTVAGGNPAKLIRSVLQKDIDFWTWGKQLYVDLAKKYLRIGINKIG